MLRISIFYFFLLVLASTLSFFLIFGVGFTSDLNFGLFLIPAVFAALWAFTYIWQLPFKKKNYRILFGVSGTVIIYNILLSTLFPDPRAAQSGWIFIGTPAIMLIIWYVLIYWATRKNTKIHWLIWILFIGILLSYAWSVTSFYCTKVISPQ